MGVAVVKRIEVEAQDAQSIDKYRNSVLVVIGVHTHEFDVEKQMPNVEKAVSNFGIPCRSRQ